MSNNFPLPILKLFNANPPEDDGSVTSRNRGKFSTIVSKLARPLFIQNVELLNNIETAFSKIETRAITFTKVTEPNSLAFSVKPTTQQIFCILVGQGGPGRAGTGGNPGNGGGGGSVIILFDTVINPANLPVIACSTTIAGYTNNGGGVSGTAGNGFMPGNDDVDTLGAGGTGLSGFAASSVGVRVGIRGEIGGMRNGTFPGLGGKSFFGIGGPGAGGNGGEVDSAAPALPSASVNVATAWVWEIE